MRASLVIEHKHLPEEVRKEVKALMNARELRFYRAGLLPLVGTAGIITILNFFAYDLRERIQGSALSLTPLILLLGAPVAWHKNNKEIVWWTDRVAKAIAKHGVIAEEHIGDYPAVGKNYSYAAVSTLGDIHLLRATRVNEAIAKAQRTFLKNILPSRTRAKID